MEGKGLSVLKKLQTLHDISVLLNSTLDLQEVLARALSSAEDLLDVEVSSIFVHSSGMIGFKSGGLGLGLAIAKH